MKNKKAAVAALVVLAAGIAGAAPGDPLGGEFLVNSQTAGFQAEPAVSMALNGRFAVAWSGAGSEDDSGVYVRLYGAAGLPRGDQAPVNTTTTGSQLYPAVAMSKYGIFMVAWTSDGQDGSGYGVYARMFGYDGSPSSDELPVNTTTLGNQSGLGYGPAVATDFYGGRYIVVWGAEEPGGYGVYGRLFNSWGEASGAEFRINTLPSAGPPSPAVEMDDSGTFVVAWDGQTAGSTANDIVARRFDGTGLPLGAEFRVNTTTGIPRGSPAVATDAAGNFVIAWHGAPFPFDPSWIYAQRFDATGAPVGGEMSVTAGPWGARRPAVAMDHDGDFAVVWESLDQDSSDYGVYGKRFLAAGIEAGPEFRVNVNAGGAQLLGGAAMDADGEFAVAYGSEGLDGDSYGVAARRYQGGGQAELSVDIQDTQDPVTLGGSFAYSITVTNNSPSMQYEGVDYASGVTVQVDLAPGVTLASAPNDPLSWVCTGTGPVVCTSTNAMAPTGSDTLWLYVTAPGTPGSVEAIATVSADQQDPPSPDNNIDREYTLVGDTTPDAFTFTDAAGVEPGTVQISDAVVVTGLELAAPIRVYGGEYSVDGGNFTSADGTIGPGQQVRVRHASAAGYQASVGTTLDIGGVSDTFVSTTRAKDETPDPFSFVDPIGVARGAEVISDPITVNGLDDFASITVDGGFYSVNGGVFSDQPGTVGNGDSVRARHIAAADFSSQVHTLVCVGSVCDLFSSTTLARDTAPDAFAFTDQFGAPRNAEIVSDEIVVTGINDATIISASGNGTVSIDGGPFVAGGTVAAGQRVRVRHVSAATFGTITDTQVCIGGVCDTFTSTTETEDTTPAPFGFTDQAGVATGTTITSDSVTIDGINSTAAVAVSGGSYSINGGAFVTSAGTVVAGDSIRVQHVSSASAGTTVSTTLTVGGLSDVFSSTTGATDTTPDAFGFTDVTGVRTNARVVSSTITVAGVNTPVTLTVSGGDAQYSKNGGKYASVTTTVAAGDTVRVRVTSASSALTTVDVVVTIGGLADTWSVTTR